MEEPLTGNNDDVDRSVRKETSGEEEEQKHPLGSVVPPLPPVPAVVRDHFLAIVPLLAGFLGTCEVNALCRTCRDLYQVTSESHEIWMALCLATFHVRKFFARLLPPTTTTTTHTTEGAIQANGAA
jgi:hypothetical protein